MKINKTNQEVINEINENGYCLLENCFTNDDLDEMKKFSPAIIKLYKTW